MRALAARGKGRALGHALESARAVLAALEEYFGVGYAYDKLDVLAVPDLAYAAMENAGAITFREQFLLVDAQTPALRRRSVEGVLTHELAHQWFGNLVTMRWWDDVWLSESFASWMTHHLIGVRRPDYREEESFLDVLHGAMDTDSLAAARPIRRALETAAEIHDAFDALAYTKGTGVLAMFERFMGSDAFRAGIRGYLERYRFGSADANDFFAALSAAAGRDVASAIRTFLFQPGVPLVDAEVTCGSGGATLRLAQERFLPLGSHADRKRHWQVPVCVRYAVGASTHRRCFLLRQPEERFALPEGCPRWLHPNADGAGYYRFWMRPADAAALTAAVPALSVRELLALGDAVQAAFAQARIPFAEAMRLLAPFAASPDRLLARMPRKLFELARARLVPDADRGRVEANVRRMYARGLSLGAASEEERLHRREALETLAFLGRDPRARAQVQRLAPTDPDLVEAADTIAVEDGGERALDAQIARLRSTQEGGARARILAALARVSVPSLRPRIVALALDPVLRVSERFGLLERHFERADNAAAGWPWLREHLEAIASSMPPSLAGELPTVLSGSCDEAIAREMEEKLGPRMRGVPGFAHYLAQAGEQIRLCAALVRAHAANARAYFTGFVSLSAPARAPARGASALPRSPPGGPAAP